MPERAKNQSLWTRNFIIISVINLLLYSSWQMFPSALPPYVSSLGGAPNILGWINGVATIATLIIRPFSGSIMDKFGRKGIFNFGLILMIISTAAYSFWPIVGVILAVRFIHGLAWGITSTASNTVATDNIQPDKMARGMTFFSLSVTISSAIAPALALSLNTKTMIWTGVALVLLAFIMNLTINYPVHVPSSNKTKSAPYEKNSALPTVIMFLITTTYGAILTFLALFAAEKGHQNIGLFFTLYAVGMLVTRPFLGSLLEKKGFSAGVIPGAIIIFIALVILSQAEAFAVFMVAGTLYGIGYGMLHTSLQTMSVMSAPPNRIGAANATFFTGFDGGMGFGAIIAGVLSSSLGFGKMYAVLSICPIIALLIYLLFKNKKK